MAVTSSGKIEIGVNIKGVDGTGKATKNAVKNIRGVEKAQKRAGKASSALTKTAFRFNMITEAAGKVAQAVGAVAAEMKKQAEVVASAERAFGSYDKALEALANTGGAMSIGTFSKFSNILQQTGLDIEITQEQIDKIGSLAASMGKDSDEAFELFAQSIAKGNTRGLQSIGIFANMEVEMRRVSKATGKSTEEFTHLDRQALALDIALRGVEDAAVRGGSAFGQMDQAGRNLGNAFDEVMANTLVPLGEFFAGNINMLFDEFGTKGAHAGVKISASVDQLAQGVGQLAGDISTTARELQSFVQAGEAAERRNAELLTTSEIIGKINKAEQEAQKAANDNLESLAKERKIRSSIMALNKRAAKLEQDLTKKQEAARNTVTARFKNFQALQEKRLQRIAELQAVNQRREEQGLARSRSVEGLIAEKKEEMQKAEREAGAIINEQTVIRNKALAALEKQEENLEQMRKTETTEREALRKIQKSSEQIADEHNNLVNKRLGILKAIHSVTMQQAQRGISQLQTLKDMMQVDQERLGATAKGTKEIQTLERDLFNMRALEAQRQAQRNKMELTAELAKARNMEQQAAAKWKEAGAQTRQAKNEIAIAQRMKARGAQELQGVDVDEFIANKQRELSILKETEKASKAAFFAQDDFTKSTKQALEIATRLSAYTMNRPEETFATMRRRKRSAGAAADPALELPDAPKVDKEAALLALRRERLSLAENVTDAQKLANLQEESAIALAAEKLRIKKEEAQMTAHVTAALEASGKAGELTAEEAARLKANSDAFEQAEKDQKKINEKRLELLSDQRIKKEKDLQKAIQERFKQDLAAITQQLNAQSAIQAAEQLHIERLEKINDLKARGLDADRATTLEIQSQAQKRLAMFDQFGQNTEGAIQMALSMDSIVAKYSQMEGAAQQAGETSLTAGQQFVKSTAMFMQAVNQQSQQINDVITAFKQASEESGESYQKAIGGAIAVGGKLAAAVIEDERTKAAILGASELAASFASYPDPVGMTSHGIAAAMYFAIAGSAGKGKAAATETEPPQVTAQGGAEEQMQPGTTIININAPVLSGTGAETGAMLGEWMEGAKGAGFGM